MTSSAIAVALLTLDQLGPDPGSVAVAAICLLVVVGLLVFTSRLRLRRNKTESEPSAQHPSSSNATSSVLPGFDQATLEAAILALNIRVRTLFGLPEHLVEATERVLDKIETLLPAFEQDDSVSMSMVAEDVQELITRYLPNLFSSYDKMAAADKAAGLQGIEETILALDNRLQDHARWVAAMDRAEFEALADTIRHLFGKDQQ